MGRFGVVAAIFGTLGLGTLTLATPVAAQTVDGGAYFSQHCQMCHTITAGQPHGVGPNLAGVVGRKAASTDFYYSDALKASGLAWTKANLDKFLTAPGQMVPGTRMMVSIPDPKQRAALVDFLAKQKP